MKSPLDRPHSKFYNQLEFTPKNYALNLAAEAVFIRLEVHTDMPTAYEKACKKLYNRLMEEMGEDAWFDDV
tara:strand:- start:797 stop:1009 length:213 start_codon:yes stop_codon:yes gene_type:complete